MAGSGVDANVVQVEDETESNNNQMDVMEEDKTTDKCEKISKFPLSRIKSIIKLDPDVTLASQEAVFLIAKATEFFVDALSKESYNYTLRSKKKTLMKKDVDSSMDAIDAFVFLEGTLD